MADPETLLVRRKGPSLCNRCNALYEKVLLFVEPVFSYPGGDGHNAHLTGLASMQISACCGYIQPAPLKPERIIAALEHMKDCRGHDG